MANEEQLSILKQGVRAWNEWRKENRDTEINLFGAKLIGINLFEANLHHVNLGWANLRGANLSRADLSEADLGGADFRNAILSEVYLWKADLRQANLSGADLSEANLEEAMLWSADLSETDLNTTEISKAFLREANLSWAYLKNAYLSEAYLGKANLSNADLSKANLWGADFTEADLSNAVLWSAILSGANLTSANLRGANLSRADLRGANLSKADLKGADLRRADLTGADLSEADLGEADLRRANLSNAMIWKAILSGADLTGANLTGTLLIGTVVGQAKISQSSIYAISVWDLQGEFDEQRELIITPEGDPVITVDNIKVAQFIYLILNNEEIRDVINTLTSKSVLILGRFAIPERKAILNALRDKLREYHLLPIVFDFDRPTDKDFTETIKTLAGLSYFVIADVTNPKSSPLELQATVPDYQIPFVPIIQEGEKPFAMMANLQTKYDWVLDTVSYNSLETLMQALKPAIIDRAIQKHNELRILKARQPKILSASDFINDKGLDNQSN